MDRPVMVLAEQEHVRKIGLATLGPVDDVVRRTPRGRTLAPGPATVLVAGIQQPPSAAGDDALFPSGVDDRGVPAEQNPRDRAVACKSLHGLCRDGQRERHLTCGRPDQALQGLQRGGDLNVGAHGTMLRNRPAVKAVGSKLNEAIRVTALAASAVAVAVSLRERFECGAYGCPLRPVERTLDVQRSIVAVGEAQVALLGGLALCLGHAIRIAAMPLVHRVIPEPANAALLGGL